MVLRPGIRHILALLSLVQAPVLAQVTEAGPVSESEARFSSFPELEELIQELRRRNPELQGMRANYQAARAREPQAAALADPKLSAGWAAAGAPWPGAGLGEEPTANLGFQISQELPYPGKRSLRKEQAGREARFEGYRLRAREIALITQLKSAYHELRGIQEQLLALDRQADVIRQLSLATEARYGSGAGSQQDLWAVRLEATQLEAARIPLNGRRQAVLAEIAALVDRDRETLLLNPPVQAELPALPDQTWILAAARRNSPALGERRTQVEVRRLGVELARRDYYPDFEVMAGYYNMGGMKDMWEAQVRINIPLWFADRQRPALEESASRLVESERQVRAADLELSAQLAARRSDAEAALQTLDLYRRRLLPDAGFALEAALAEYESGKGDLTGLLSALKSLVEFELELPEWRTKYFQSLVALEALAGIDLGA